MAISATAATCRSMASTADRPTTVIASSSTSSSSKLSTPSSSSSSSHSSLQFPIRLPRISIGSQGISSRSHPRILPVVQAKKETFASLDELLANSDKPVLVDFYATWCGPCQFMAPVLDQVSVTLQDKIKVVKIDTEKYPSIADKYRIEALPTFILFKDGEPCDRFEGALPADQLVQRIGATLEAKN